MKQGDLFSVQMYADIPWVLATGGQKGEVAIWDTEEDSKVRQQFKGQMPVKAKSLKSKADKGFEAGDAAMVEEGEDSSGFEDVDSDEESETLEEPAKATKAKGAKKASKK